jgi:hypothetical protein
VPFHLQALRYPELLRSLEEQRRDVERLVSLLQASERHAWAKRPAIVWALLCVYR